MSPRLFAAACLIGCSLQRPKPPVKFETIAIVAAEAGGGGLQLVAIDERGDRRFEVVAAPDVPVRDSNPAISPDGRWMVFASTRERQTGTSLWIAPLGKPRETPWRLTPSSAIDQHAIWTRDGKAIVFASTRDGGDFDLWRLPIDAAGHAGTPLQLTRGAGHEVTPTLGPAGTIVYAALEQKEGSEVESHLEERAPDGAIRKLTSGPADVSPAISPDGATLVFVRPALHGDTPQAELWKIERGAWRSTADVLEANLLVPLPITDESGPVWSRDGRFVFATSVLRGDGGRPVFSSVIHVDLEETPARVRILVDHAVAAVRLSPAIRSERLDAAALHGDPEYLPELARIVSKSIAEQTTEPP